MFMKINQRIRIPCKTKIESVITNKDSVGVIIRGKLIECGIPTRNGIAYTLNSMNKFIQEFNNSKKSLPFLDSHDDSSIRTTPPFGHVTKLFSEGNNIFYEADIDPEEKTFLHKLKRGDISEVSLQAIVDAVDEQEGYNGDNIIIADVRELLEISSVLIPGAKGTSAEIQEGCISEEIFSEAFHLSQKNKITFKESLLRIKEAKDNNELAGGQVRLTDEEELNTDNGSALIGVALPKDKKIKSVELFHRARILKLNSWRI